MKKRSFPVLMSALVALVTLLVSSPAFAQTDNRQERENAKIEALKKLIDERHFVFVAQNATPMNGRTRPLTYPYELRVKKDTIDSDLPYYGKAYTVEIGSTEGGINFTTSDFDYSTKDDTKGGWDIFITPRKIRDVQKMSLFIATSGYGTLQVTSNTRQMISFYGQIRETGNNK